MAEVDKKVISVRLKENLNAGARDVTNAERIGLRTMSPAYALDIDPTLNPTIPERGIRFGGDAAIYRTGVHQLSLDAVVDIRGSLLVNGAPLDESKILLRLPRGEAISGARGVYIEGTGQNARVYCASCLDPAKKAVGFVKEAGPENGLVDVWMVDTLPGLSGIVPGRTYFLGANGEFAASLPENVKIRQVLGVGLDEDRIYGNVQQASYFE